MELLRCSLRNVCCLFSVAVRRPFVVQTGTITGLNRVGPAQAVTAGRRGAARARALAPVNRMAAAPTVDMREFPHLTWLLLLVGSEFQHWQLRPQAVQSSSCTNSVEQAAEL